MNQSMNIEVFGIVRPENIKSLEIRISRIRKMLSEENTLEHAIIELMVTSLISHGKSENQIRQISQISKILGESLGLGLVYCNRLELAARVYDIGNLIIDSEVYEKEDQLTFEEFRVVKNHTITGYDMLISQNFLSMDLAAVISAEHHEWWNGGGYPRGLKEKEMDIASRIVAVADTVGALYTKRPGREAWSYTKILEYLKSRSGMQFDPDVIEVFFINQKIIEEVLRMDLASIPTKWYE